MPPSGDRRPSHFPLPELVALWDLPQCGAQSRERHSVRAFVTADFSKGGQRLANDLIHIVVAIGGEAPDEVNFGSFRRERLIFFWLPPLLPSALDRHAAVARAGPMADAHPSLSPRPVRSTVAVGS